MMTMMCSESQMTEHQGSLWPPGMQSDHVRLRRSPHRRPLLTSHGVSVSRGAWKRRVHCSRMQSYNRSALFWQNTTAVTRQSSSTCSCAGTAMNIPRKLAYNGRWKFADCHGFLSTVYGSVALPAPLLALRTLLPRSLTTSCCRKILVLVLFMMSGTPGLLTFDAPACGVWYTGFTGQKVKQSTCIAPCIL